jgi:hypothetical protein
MISYRFKRRAFLTAMSGGVGLKVMLRTLEGSAQGTRSPARLLVTHWPVGIVAGQGDALWKPTSGSVGGSPGLKPFADLGLGPDMTVVRGLSTPVGIGGSHESGTVGLVTGLASPGTRSGEAESDDAFAGGPSFEQILLKNVPDLQRPGPGFANSIADSRTDFGEISTKCLSYSTELQAVSAAIGAGPEAKPLLPLISPFDQFTNLFSGFVPGTAGTGGGQTGGTGGAGGGAPQPVADAVLKKLVGRRSVLDFSVEELNRLKQIAPGDAKHKLGIHTDAVVAAETALTNAINTAYPNVGGGTGGTTGGAGGATGNGDPICGGGCTTRPSTPPLGIVGKADPTKGAGNAFNCATCGAEDDAPLHAQAGGLHLSVLKAAFICDLIRVGTYQWSPGTNHVGFTLYPGSTAAYMHHPQSHKIITPDTMQYPTLSQLNATAQFLFNVQTWYFARHAENFAAWKSAVDGCGNSLLDFTCVPFLTEVQACGGERTSMPGMIIGGRRLGFIHDRYVTGQITINQLWATIAQAFGYTLTAPPFAAPLAGFWARP